MSFETTIDNIKRFASSQNYKLGYDKRGHKYTEYKLTENDLSKLLRMKYLFGSIPRSLNKMSKINKKVVINSYKDLKTMNQLCYNLCIQNVKIYKNWCNTFCPEYQQNFSSKIKLGSIPQKINIDDLQIYLLPTDCNKNNNKLKSFLSNKNTSMQNSVILMRTLFNIKKPPNTFKVGDTVKVRNDKSTNTQQIKKINGNTITLDDLFSDLTITTKNKLIKTNIPTVQSTYSKEYCIITNEFCRNIKEIFSMLPVNNINFSKYDSNMKNIVHGIYKPVKSSEDFYNYTQIKEIIDRLFN